ncbi:hypothetical protein D9M71_548650 [compost metagenome]
MQQVTLGQLGAFTVQPAQAFAQLAGDAAQYWLGADAIHHRQVGTLAAAGEADLQALPGLQAQTRPSAPRFAVHVQRHIRAGQRHPERLFGFQFDTAQGDFQHRAAERIAQQSIGPGHRQRVHGPGGGNPQVLPAEASAVLQQAQRAGLDHPQAAHASPPSAR